jgi:Flp pilus assembly protein TadG
MFQSTKITRTSEKNTRTIQKLAADRSGSATVIFGIGAVAIIGFAGVAIDYGRVLKVRTTLQVAIDNGVLAAARQRALEQSDAEAFLQAYIKQNWKAPFGSNIVTSSLTDVGKNGIRGDAETSVPMAFMQLLGTKSVSVKATAQGAFGQRPTEVALVLDTTGSMTGGKLADLQAAAKGLIDAAYADPQAKSKIKFAIAPFSDHVNVGIAARSKAWMSVPADYSATTNQCSTTTPVISKSGCSMQTLTGYNDGIPFTYQTEVCSSYTYGAPVTTCGPQTVDYKFYGCVGSRTHPLDVQQPLADASKPVPGLLNVKCNSEITRLTDDKSKLFDNINSFVAQNETYIASGLIWGWRLVSHEAPFADGANPAAGVATRKTIVLMTDGSNTRSPTYPEHFGWDSNQANTLTAELCASIKKANVEIYAIAFNVTDTTSQNLLKSCATGAPYYHNATSTAELMASFKAIGANLSVVTLTR